MMIPLKTTVEDLDKLTAYLRPQFGWVSLAKVKANLEKVSDNRKIESARWLGLIQRDGQNVEITAQGRSWASAQDPGEKTRIFAAVLAGAPLYAQTVEWMYHTNKSEPTKTDVGDQWYKHNTGMLEGAQGAALGDGVIMFMRVAEAAGLGKFITAGKNRPETYLKGDRAAIEKFYNTFVLGQTSEETAEDSKEHEDAPEVRQEQQLALPAGSTPAKQVSPPVTLQASPAIHINLEIHIAADATAETVAEIFKNMRKYVLNDGSSEAGDRD